MNTSSKRQADAQSRHAVVLGGSLAGLLAAQVLSDHFDEVTLIERDVFKETAEVRPRIQHDDSTHPRRSFIHAFCSVYYSMFLNQISVPPLCPLCLCGGRCDKD